MSNTDVPLRQRRPESAWRSMVSAILSRHALPVRDLEPMATGSDVVWAAGDLIVKTTDPQWADEIAAECHAMELTRDLPMDTPELVAHGEMDGWPYVVMTRLAGQSLGSVWSGLDRDQRRDLARNLGETLAILHSLHHPEPEAWEPFLQRLLADVGASHRRAGASPEWLERIDAFVAATPRTPRPTVFLHTEYLEEHVLVKQGPQGWRVSGLIDFADSRAGNPGYEFPAIVEFVFKGEPGMLGACLEAYGIPREQRTLELGHELLAWGLIHQFGSLPRMLRAIGAPEPRSAEALVERLYDPRQAF